MNKVLEKYSQAIIEQAHLDIAPFIEHTPVLQSHSLNKIAGCELYFKCENFQKIGAFKMRGATHALMKIKAEGKYQKVVTHSSGNHAQAVAKAAQTLGLKAFIVMPNNAPKIKVNGVKAFGGEVHFCEPTLAAREKRMNEIRQSEGAVFVPPFDHEDVILGQATAAKELLNEVGDLDAIITPVGGGGLLGGSALSAHYWGKQKISCFGAEPEGADDTYRSFEAKKLIPQIKPHTISDGLLTSVGVLNFEVIQVLVKNILLVNDAETIQAMRLIWERLKIIIEPSCAVPFAAVLRNPELFKNQKVGIILSGGNVDLDAFFDNLKPKT